MFHREHEPPHFHASYGEFEALIGIDSIKVVGGHLPARVRNLVFEWAALHQAELVANWQRARRRETIEHIAPLP